MQATDSRPRSEQETAAARGRLLTPWTTSLASIAALLAAAAVLGAAVDRLWFAIACALAGYLGWHLVNLYRLHRWLKVHRRFSPPTGFGIWSEVFGAMYQRQRESQARKQRLLSIVKEFRDATAAVPAGIVILDRAHRVQWFNPGAEALLGLVRGDATRRSLVDLMPESGLQDWLTGDEQPDELLVAAPTGAARLSLRVIPYAKEHTLLIAQDVTQLQRVEAMRKDFVANVSHELRTPLTVISGYVEALEAEAGEEWQFIITRMAEQSARMRAIVEDLLTLSRLDAIGALEDRVIVNVHGVLTSVAYEAEALSAGRHTLVWHASSTIAVWGSPADLRSAFMNLVSNAIRYTPDGGRISFRWFFRDGQAVFEVKDDGPGIAPEHVSRLTERFYRVSTDRSRATGGTGLGLAIVKNILMLHDAVLEIDSTLGAGSCFRAIFPADRTVDGVAPPP